MVFLDEVSKEVVAKYADDVVANGKSGLKLENWQILTLIAIGGTVKERYYESPGGINVRDTIARVRLMTHHDLIRGSLPLLKFWQLSRISELMRSSTSVRPSQFATCQNCD